MMSIVRHTVLARALDTALRSLLISACAATFAATFAVRGLGQSAKAKAEPQGVWLAIAASPAKSPLPGAEVAINGKATGLSDAKGLIFIKKNDLFHHSVTVAVAKAGYQTLRRKLALTPRPKSQRTPAYRLALAAIPARLGRTPAAAPLAGPFPPKPPAEQPLAKLPASKNPIAGAATPTVPRYRLAELPKPAATPIRVLPRLKARANTPAPLLTIELLEKPRRKAKAKTQAKATAKSQAKSASDQTSDQATEPPPPFRGAVGRLVYAKPKGLVAYCDLSLGRCTFPLTKSPATAGLRPKQLTITGDGIKTKTVTIRSPKSQTVKVTIERQELASTPSKRGLGAFAASYDAWSALGRPALYAADGELTAEETANLLRYGSTVKPVTKKKRRKGKKAAKDQSQEPSLGWRDVRVESPGYVATGAGNEVERAFAPKAYKPPRVTLVTLGLERTRATSQAKAMTAIDKVQLAKTELSWLPERELKAELARRGRALTAWLNSTEATVAADFAVILAAIKGESQAFLALLQARASGQIIAAKRYAKGAEMEAAINQMLGHIPYEVTAIASKDGDIALNMPKALFSRLTAKAPNAMTLRRVSASSQHSQPISLQATKSYPRLTYFSALSVESAEGEEGTLPAGTRIRVGQRFIAGQTANLLPPSPSKAQQDKLQVKGQNGKSLAEALIWTDDGAFRQANEKGEISGAQTVAGFFHPSYGAYSIRAQKAFALAEKPRRALTITAERLIELTTAPVPAHIAIADKELGVSPLALYPGTAGLTSKAKKAVAVKVTPLSQADNTKANAYGSLKANVNPARLLAKQGYAVKLSPDHRARIKALMAAGKYKEAERYLKTLPRATRSSFDFTFLRAAILAERGQHKACYSAFRKLSRMASKQKVADRLAASTINESVCLSQMIRKKPALKNLRQTLASLKAAEKKAGKGSSHLPAMAFYSSHLKYLHWRATGNKAFLDDAVRGYRYYLTMTAPQSASDERLASFKIEAKKVIAMAEQ